MMYMQKEQQKYDPNLQITWRNLYAIVYAILSLPFALPYVVELANE